MAFKASIQTQADALRRAMETAIWMKNVNAKASADLAGTVSSDMVIRLVDESRSAIVILNAQAAVPGIGAYAQSQFNDPAYNVGAEFTAMVNAITAVVNWVVANFPKDAGGFLLGYTFNADGSRAPRNFTAAQTVGLKSAVDAVVAAIA